ncbi:MAG: hypothetical protein EOO20_10705, partial [Chryseobacterium sp.]
MNKRVLIISPYFAPANAADMQRIRMSLPYFEVEGWDADLVTVDPQYLDISFDKLLLQSVPKTIQIHSVKAFSRKWTKWLGLGSLALRSMWFYFRKVNTLLTENHYDLIYFSTTQFPVLTLGAYWKQRFGIPYVIDMQDPWHSEYYQDKPKDQRPAKHWFSYRLNKFLEPIAMRHVDGLISVSQGYLDLLNERYGWLTRIPQRVITFAAFQKDIEIALNTDFKAFLPKGTRKNIVYIGRGGHDLAPAVILLLKALKLTKLQDHQIHFYFLGTSYAADGKGEQSIAPIASKFGLTSFVTEQTDRIPFYKSLNILSKSDALFIPGSDDANYTASKIFPYIML